MFFFYQVTKQFASFGGPKLVFFTFFNFEFSFCRLFFDVIGRYLCKFLEINIHFKVLCRGGRPNSQIICNWTHISIPDRESIVPVFENLKKCYINLTYLTHHYLFQKDNFFTVFVLLKNFYKF